jgi:hypothetical protein
VNEDLYALLAGDGDGDPEDDDQEPQRRPDETITLTPEKTDLGEYLSLVTGSGFPLA